jgi:hypothetical protein
MVDSSSMHATASAKNFFNVELADYAGTANGLPDKYFQQPHDCVGAACGRVRRHQGEGLTY